MNFNKLVFHEKNWPDVIGRTLTINFDKCELELLYSEGLLSCCITQKECSAFKEQLALCQLADWSETYEPPAGIAVLDGRSWSLNLFDGKLQISAETIVTIITSIVIMIVLMWFVKKTKPGHAMQAVSEDRGAAQLMGINVNGIISLTFAIGSALAAIAGALLLSSYPTLTPTTGAMPGIKAFTAAVFGGIGSIPGAFLGGILLGVIENLSKAYISTQLSDAIVFLVLIIILLVRPTGLLGKKTTVKV